LDVAASEIGPYRVLYITRDRNLVFLRRFYRGGLLLPLIVLVLVVVLVLAWLSWV